MPRTHAINEDSIWTSDVSDRFRDAINHVGGLKKCSDLVGVTAEQVGRWRDGKSKAPFTAVARIVGAAGYTLDWLLTGDIKPRTAMGGSKDIDEELLAKIANTITDLYRRENTPLPPGELAHLLARKYREIAMSASDPKEVDAMVKLVATQLSNDIRKSAG